MLNPTQHDALSVLKRLRSAGFEAYFAGGCVRDSLMGQQPKDFDVATSASPKQVRGLFNNTQAVGAAFGVILVRERQSTVEVATFRTDLEYQDGRHPTGVQFATAQEDAQRRDFTINGLFLDPIENKIIDYVDGQADLLAKRLRAIGNPAARFREDHLRMLRALRFASRLNFGIEPETASAIENHAKELIRISPERIADELRKMLTPVSRNQAYRLLSDFGFIPILMRFLPEKALRQRDELKSIFLNLLMDPDDSSSISFGLGLAAAVLDFRMNASGDLGPGRWLAQSEVKRAAHAMRQSLKISNDESNEMTGAMGFVQLITDRPPSVATMKRFLNQPFSSDAEKLMVALARAGLMTGLIESLHGRLQELRQTDFVPEPLITGDDLTAAGAAPGPRFKLALDAAYDAQLEGRITTKDQAMQLAMQQVTA